jgi:hypothetical protein
VVYIWHIFSYPSAAFIKTVAFFKDGIVIISLAQVGHYLHAWAARIIYMHGRLGLFTRNGGWHYLLVGLALFLFWEKNQPLLFSPHFVVYNFSNFFLKQSFC